MSLSAHRDTGRFNWTSEIYSDAAGYYMYLPVTFLYGFDYERFPAGIDDSAGCTFIDHGTKKFAYKYTCGVALLVSPFFAGTVLCSSVAGVPLDGGFSDWFHRMADVSGAFYLIVGLFFTGLVLKRYAEGWIRYAVLLLIFFGTNLWFYTIRQPLMSHVYSFAAISVYLYAIHRFLERRTRLSLFLVALAYAVAVLIRPANGIIILLLLLWNVNTGKELVDRIRTLVSWKNLTLFLATLGLVLLPQLLYWQYMFGSPVHYAYEGESFSNWASPRFAEVWIAPLNGLFLYNPLWLVMIAGVVWMAISRRRNGFLLLGFFLLASYVVAAWHSWFFGCGYGHRAFIDFLPLYALPLALVIRQWSGRLRGVAVAGLVMALTAMTSYNQMMISSYSGCFFGSVWDWHRYALHLKQAGFYQKQAPVYVLTNDFENGAVAPATFRSADVSRSYNRSARLDSLRPTGSRTSLFFFEFALPFPTRADAAIYVLAPEGRTNGARLHCWIEREGQVLYHDSVALDPYIIRRSDWCLVRRIFSFPPDMPWDATITVELRNPDRMLFFADDLKVVYY